MFEETNPKGWHVARISFEAITPLSCGAGEGESADNAIARDPNGLPFVPGSTLQGLLRAFFTGRPEEEGKEKEALFGSELGNREQSRHRAAALYVSHARVHDSKNNAVGFPVNVAGDDLLTKLANGSPMVREHVRLDHRHTAEDAGKFDRAAVPAGTRFSFELLLYGEEGDGEKLDDVIGAMNQSDFRIGSSGARGYGKIALVGETKRRFFTPDAYVKFRQMRRSTLSSRKNLDQVCHLESTDRSLVISFDLIPINPWRSGQDGTPVTTENRKKSDDKAKAVDLAPTREVWVDWTSGQGVWQSPEANGPSETDQSYILAGSSIRGPLAHRTLFWWNRQNNAWLDDNSTSETVNAYLANRTQLESLFGRVKGDNGQASLLLVDDVKVHVQKVIDMTHVKIDYFTGGAFPNALFSEELIKSDALSCKLVIRPPKRDDRAIGEEMRKAFLFALGDLLTGRLALGAKSYGFCKGGDLNFIGANKDTWEESWSEVKKHHPAMKQEAVRTEEVIA